MTPTQKAGLAVAAIGAGITAILLGKREAQAATGGQKIPIIPAPVPMPGDYDYPSAYQPVQGSSYAPPSDVARGDPTVLAYQQRLADLGYDPGPLDGRYGPMTARAVTDFQRDSGLGVDGILGPRTKAAIDAAYGQPMATSGFSSRRVWQGRQRY